MSTDTRPSVTVIGDYYNDFAFDGYSIVLNADPGIGLKDGDEVEVTIKKHTRTTGNLLGRARDSDEDERTDVPAH